MDREEYLQSQYDRVTDALSFVQEGVTGYTREEYISRQLTRINSEVPPCPNSQSSRGIIPAYNVTKDNLRNINILICRECGYEIHYFPSQQDGVVS